MKKLIINIFLLFVMVGCSNVNDTEKALGIDFINSFFYDINIIGSDVDFNYYFSDDCINKESFINYLTVLEVDRYNEAINYNNINILNVKKQKKLYRFYLEYDITSEETKSFIHKNSMIIYLQKQDNQFKIHSVEYGG